MQHEVVICSVFELSVFIAASVTSFLTVLAWYPNTLLRTWCLVLHSLTLMTNMQFNCKFLAVMNIALMKP